MSHTAKPIAAPVLDDQILLMLTEGDVQFRADIMASFVDSAGDIILSLAQAGDAASRRAAAHKLKGLAASIGAGVMAQLAGSWEANPGAAPLTSAEVAAVQQALADIKARV